MKDGMNMQELSERLGLMESMIAEGRRGTESWGWAFAMWGVAFYVALAWTKWRPNEAAWPVTMVCAVILTLVIRLGKRRAHAVTAIGRAVACLWVGTGISMFLVFSALGFSGHLQPAGFVAMLGAMMGAANVASGMILRWKVQTACGVVWWAASIAACFVPEAELSALFIAAVFLCQIAFGIYAMLCDSQTHTHTGAPVHA